MADLKPTWPPCSGMAYAKDSMTPEEIHVSYDENNNEIASDSPMHTSSTPQEGSFNFGAKHYANEFRSGYGVPVGGSSPSRENTTVNAQSTERGKES